MPCFDASKTLLTPSLRDRPWNAHVRVWHYTEEVALHIGGSSRSLLYGRIQDGGAWYTRRHNVCCWVGGEMRLDYILE